MTSEDVSLDRPWRLDPSGQAENGKRSERIRNSESWQPEGGDCMFADIRNVKDEQFARMYFVGT